MIEKPLLGASLYVPATHPDVGAIAAGEKLAALQSIIFCLEDAVSDAEFPRAFENMRAALRRLRRREGFWRFVRVRHPENMAMVLRLEGVEALDGFVLPKATQRNMDDYMRLLPADMPYWVMPTLETREVFQDVAMHAFAAYLEGAPWRQRIACLRIGGNDLLALLHMRRPRGRTAYETPLGSVIARLAGAFIPAGFALSAPVFEHLEDVQTLRREVQADLAHGLSGKSAVHPQQVAHIERLYRVPHADIEAAQRIVCADAPGVFALHRSMCEPATHRAWAVTVLAAARRFGCVEPHGTQHV